MPGGWYRVSELFEEDNLDLEVVVSSCHLELIPENDAVMPVVVSPSPSKSNSKNIGGGSDCKKDGETIVSLNDFVSKRFIDPLHTLKSKIQALEDERSQLIKELDRDHGGDNLASDKTEQDDTNKPAGQASTMPNNLDSSSMDCSRDETSRDAIRKIISEIIEKVESRCCEKKHASASVQPEPTDKSGIKMGGPAIGFKKGKQKTASLAGLQLYRLQKQLERVQSKIAQAKREQDDFVQVAMNAQRSFGSLIDTHSVAIDVQE